MEPWQYMSLLSPPALTTKISGFIDIKSLSRICEKSIKVLSRQSPLHKESALLSRFLYKYDKKFRNDIGYRNIRKTNSALRKYLQLNLIKDIENFSFMLPNEHDENVPTRQMLEYVLVRLMTFAKLMFRICMCSKQAAIFYLDRVKRGESHWMSLMPYASLSRIWSICFVLLQNTANMYSNLHPFLSKLEYKGMNFLPTDYKLPVDFDDWLDLNYLDTYGKFNWCLKKANVGHIDDDEDAFDNIFDYAAQINGENEEMSQDLPISEEIKDIELENPNGNKIDMGQAISRDSYKLLTESLPESVIQKKEIRVIDRKQSQDLSILTNFQKKISNENKGTHYFGRVTNAKSLQDFLEKEEALRNDGNDKCLTSHLSFMQWHTLKSALLKVCESITNRKLERKLQKVWKDKCLDYL